MELSTIDCDVFFSILGHLSELVPYFSEVFFILLLLLGQVVVDEDS